MLAGMASVVADAAEGERSLGRTLVSDAALLALWPSTDSGDEDLGEEAPVDAVIRTGSVTPTGEAEVRELAEEGGATDQDFCQRLQCPIGSVLHLTDSEASWGENRSPWSQCGDNDEADTPPHRSEPPAGVHGPEVTTQDEAIDLLDGPGSRWGPIETARDSYDDSKFVDHQPLVGPVEGDRHPLLLSENLGVEPGTDLLDGPGSRWDRIEMASDCYDVSKLKDCMPLEGPEGEGRPLPAGQDAALPALGEQAGEQRSCKRRKTCWNTSGWSDAKRQKFGAEGLICISMARTWFLSS